MRTQYPTQNKKRVHCRREKMMAVEMQILSFDAMALSKISQDATLLTKEA